MEVRAASLAEVPPGRCMLTEVNGTRVVLARVGERVYACADTCSHRGGPLSEGKLAGPRLTCPWHGWMYDVRTGQCLLPARGSAIATYSVRVEGDEIWIEVP
ncbi:MAG TPA: Rieske (2Fe-2S) protein [Candidatus Acidoferrales bacterium]|nr:Rieske (2Fe-2S) protein [Candidatus Acidoferrales bacterium]